MSVHLAFGRERESEGRMKERERARGKDGGERERCPFFTHHIQ